MSAGVKPRPATASQTVSILGVGLAEQRDWPEREVMLAGQGSQAMELLRLLRFDLVVVDAGLPDGSALSFARTLRRCRPGQRWAMVGSTMTASEEITARTLGVLAVLDVAPSWPEMQALLQRVRRSTRFPVRAVRGVGTWDSRGV
jgi:DNA-binding response OmpR family regulator